MYIFLNNYYIGNKNKIKSFFWGKKKKKKVKTLTYESGT